MTDLTILLERCRQGDDLAWEAFVRRFQGRIYSVALHYLRNPEEARDVAQDVFIKLYDKRRGWKTGETFVSWVLTMTRNACIDRIRRGKARGAGRHTDEQGAAGVPAPGPSPESELFASASRSLVHRAMEGLSDKNREIILLKDIQGLEFKEISKILKLPVGTLKSRSHRARLELALQVRDLDPSYGT